jgi:hypothetical protein
MPRRARTVGAAVQWILEAAWVLLLVAGGAGLVALVVILERGGRVQVELPVAYQVSSQGGPGAGSAASLTDLSGTLKTPVSAPAAAVVLGFVMVELGWALFALHQVRLLLADVLTGAAFAPRNSWRVGMLGLTIVGAGLVRGFAVLAGSWWARGHVHVPHVAFEPSFPVQVSGLAAGLLVLLLAGVFRLGSALQEDRDLTI